MSSTGYTMKITLERLPSGNFVLRNERGYRVCEAINDSQVAKFIEKQVEGSLFTLKVEPEKP